MSNKDIHEVEEPRGGDERAFKAKHKVKVTDYPVGTKVPSITTSKKKRLADPVDTEATYEEVEHLGENLSVAHKMAITKHVKKLWGRGTVSFDKQDGKHFVSHSDGIQKQVHSINMKKGVPHVTHFMSMDEEVESLDEIGKPALMAVRNRASGRMMDNPRDAKAYNVEKQASKRLKKITDSEKEEESKRAYKAYKEEVESLDELTGYRKKKLFGKDVLSAVANRAINRMELPPGNGGKLSPEKLASNKKNSKVSQMAFDRMGEETDSVYSIYWRDTNGMDKQKHGLSEEEATRLASSLEAAGSVKIFIDEEVDDDDDFFKPHQKNAMNNAKKLYTSGHLSKPGQTVGQPFLSGNKHVVVPVKNSSGQITHHYHEYDHKDGYVPPQASMSKPSSLFTEMTDAQMYVKGMKSKDDDLRKRYGKRWKDVMYRIATKNAMKEEAESLDEIAKSEEEPLHVQLRKRTNANEVSLTFKNGKTHVVSRGHANKALTMLSGLKPSDRQHAHAEMSKSHEHFMNALDGKMAKPGKASISLAGPKMKNEEVETLDESNYRKAAHAAFSGDEDAFHKHMGVSDDMQKSHPTYQNSKKKYKQLKSMSDNTSIGDAVKLLQTEEVEDLDETHRVGVTYSDPNSSSVVMRGEKKFKQVKVKAESEDEAITKAKKHFKNNGYKVHDATITTVKEEVEELNDVEEFNDVEEVNEAGDVIPPKTQKMKSSSGGENNFKLDKPRAKSFNVPTQKDRALEMDEETETGVIASKLIEKVKAAEEEQRLQEQKLFDGSGDVVEVEVVDVFQAGEFKLQDESVVVISEEQATAMNELFHSLSVENKATLLENTISDKESFIKVISFALGEDE